MPGARLPEPPGGFGKHRRPSERRLIVQTERGGRERGAPAKRRGGGRRAVAMEYGCNGSLQHICNNPLRRRPCAQKGNLLDVLVISVYISGVCAIVWFGPCPVRGRHGSGCRRRRAGPRAACPFRCPARRLAGPREGRALALQQEGAALPRCPRDAGPC